MAYKEKSHLLAAEARRRGEKRAVLADYKLQKGCTDCGYNKDARALEFDHLPGTIKVKTVAGLANASWKVIWKEVAKCEVVCANCHAIRTMERLEKTKVR